MRGEIVTLLNLRDLTLVHRYATPTNAVGAGESWIPVRGWMVDLKAIYLVSDKIVPFIKVIK